jgi:hypothetical protein
MIRPYGRFPLEHFFAFIAYFAVTHMIPNFYCFVIYVPFVVKSISSPPSARQIS